MQTLYACPNVRTVDARRAAQPAADEGVPRARLRRGHVRARVPARRARRQARPRPARAAPPQPRRHRAGRRSRRTRARTCSSATAAPSRTGSAATRCAPARPTPSSAASAWPRRSGAGGGGPPSYAWIRVGSNGHAAVVTAGQDVGTGTKTALAQIAAEELGIPLEHVTVAVGDSARGPYATLSAGSSTIPSMGPAVRAAAGRRAAADPRARRPALRRRRRGAHARGRIDRLRRTASASRSASCSGCSATARSSAPARAARTRPGCEVLTFGVQVAEVAVDVETGEVTVERIAAIHDIGRVINPLGASSQIEGGIIQGDRPHALRGAPHRPGTGPDPHAHARRLPDADDRRRPRDRRRADRRRPTRS